MERLYYEEETKVIFDSAIDSFSKYMLSTNPFFKSCPTEDRSRFVRTKSFNPEMMWKLISEVKSITCRDKDGVEITFEIKKIEPSCNELLAKDRSDRWGLKFYF